MTSTLLAATAPLNKQPMPAVQSFEDTLTCFAKNSVSILLDNMAPSIIDFTMQYIFHNPTCVAKKNHISIILEEFKKTKMPSYASPSVPVPPTVVVTPPSSSPPPSSPPSPVPKKSTAVTDVAAADQCQAIKKDGNQCTKKARKNGICCGIHSKDSNQQLVTTVVATASSSSEPEPITVEEPVTVEAVEEPVTVEEAEVNEITPEPPQSPEPTEEPPPSSQLEVPLPVATTVTPEKPYPGPVRGAIPNDFNRVPDINLCHNGDFIILKNHERTIYYDFLDEGYRPVGAIEPGSPDIKWDSRSVLESIRADFDRKKEKYGKNVKWGPR